jgi:hypothetical protein
MAKDKSLPQDVRNTYLDQAVKIEEKAAKGAGVKLAKGGTVKKMAVGGMPVASKQTPMLRPPAPSTSKARVSSTYSGPSIPMPSRTQASIDEYMKATAKRAPKRAGQSSSESTDLGGGMAKGGMVKELPKRGQRTATNMAKGGAAMKAKKK